MFDEDQGEYSMKAEIVNTGGDEGWLLDGKNFECLYQAKLNAHQLFNKKYEDISSIDYDFNNVDESDGIVFNGEATEELFSGASYFLDALECDSSDGLLFIGSDKLKNDENKEKKRLILAN